MTVNWGRAHGERTCECGARVACIVGKGYRNEKRVARRVAALNTARLFCGGDSGMIVQSVSTTYLVGEHTRLFIIVRALSYIHQRFRMFLKYRAKAGVFYLKGLDLILLERSGNTTLCILLIVLMKIYINRNPWRYERSLNPTRLMSVRPPSSHQHQLRPLQLNSLSTPCNHPARSPSPLLRDVGPIDNAPSKYRNTITTTSAPPLSRGMWAAQRSLTEELGRDEHEG
jgi:hypothetical protein